MYVVIAYDVNTETQEGRRRLRQVAKACEGRGQRVQKSVFECCLSPMQYEELLHRLFAIIDERTDSLRIYRLSEPVEEHIEAYGVQTFVDFRAPLIT